MTTETIVCGACAAAVPYGRLSCPACGELLASVAGGRRVVAGAVTNSATPAVLYDVDAGPTAAVVDGELAHERRPRDAALELPWAVEPEPVVAPAVSTPPVEPPATLADDDDPDDADDDLDDGFDDDRLEAVLPLDGRPIPSVLSPVTDRRTTAAASWDVVGLAAATTSGPVAPPPIVHAPGAYVPPPPPPAVVGGPPAPARAWAGHPDSAAARSGRRAETESRSDAAVDVTRIDEFVRWLSVAGAALSSVGFLLPWSSVVIGSPGTGYFDRWGLAGPWHVVVVIGLLVTLALALVTNPIPVWVRVGLAGLGLGALLLGLVWPYAIGPLGAGPGALIVVVGALALVVAGCVALAADRHAVVDQPV